MRMLGVFDNGHLVPVRPQCLNERARPDEIAPARREPFTAHGQTPDDRHRHARPARHATRDHSSNVRSTWASREYRYWATVRPALPKACAFAGSFRTAMM